VTPFASSTAAVLSPDGRELVVAGTDSLQVFDPRTLRPLSRRLSLPGALLYGLGVSADGREAFAERLDGMQLVDLHALQTIGPLITGSSVETAYFGPDALYVGGFVGDTLAWDLAPATVRTAACALAGRNLTAQEWQRYLAWAGPRRPTCSQYPLT